MIGEIGIITKILAIEDDPTVPLTANIPRCLVIHAQTETGLLLDVRISKDAARELRGVLVMHWQARDSR